MLRNVRVNNFRSLQNFELQLKPGINVLVGPNGAGKSNIVKWFEFLSLLSLGNLRESVGKIGGANEVFRRDSIGALERNLNFSFYGDTTAKTFDYENGKEEDIGKLRYEFSAGVSILETDIYFSYQVLKIWITPLSYRARKDMRPTIEIRWQAGSMSSDATISHNFRRLTSPLLRESSLAEELKMETEWMRGYLTQRKNIYLDHMLISNSHFMYSIFSPIINDLRYGRAYNIIPSSVRAVQDISANAGVSFDGSGVAPTIYHIKDRNLNNTYSDPFNTSKNNDGINRLRFGRMLDYFKICNDHIYDLDVTIDNFRNEFLLKVEFRYGNEASVVPLSQLSDGTIKWLALVTAIATERSAFFVEEPENFLHPKLQETIVSILRDHSTSGQRENFSLITTHSETLLNTLSPKEIIIVSMTDSRTQARRMDDPDKISQVIANSGFGLGYFYVSGGF